MAAPMGHELFMREGSAPTDWVSLTPRPVTRVSVSSRETSQWYYHGLGTRSFGGTPRLVATSLDAGQRIGGRGTRGHPTRGEPRA